MGQKLATFDSQGNITGYYDSVDSPVPTGIANVIQITQAQWQTAISTPGCTVVNGMLVVPPPPTAAQQLATAQNAQIARVSAACQIAIVAGFTSSALGTASTYPSQDKDQRNLLNAAMAAQGQGTSWTTSLWCANGGTWALTSHTAAQVLQVNSDWLAFRLAAQQKCASLTAEISAATTVSAVQAITW